MSTEDDPALPSPMFNFECYLSTIEKNSTVDNFSPNHICTIFDDFLIEFERIEQSGEVTIQIFLDAVEEIANVVLSIESHRLLDPQVRVHPLIRFLHQMLIDLLANWRASAMHLSIKETYIFLKVTIVFIHAAEQATIVSVDQDEKLKRHLFAMNELVLKIHEQVDYAVISHTFPTDGPNISSLGLLTFKLLAGHPFYYPMEQFQPMIHYLMMDWLDSYDCIQAVRRLEHGEELTNIEFSVLLTCWEYICSKSLIKQDFSTRITSIDLIDKICDELLIRVEHILEHAQVLAPEVLSHILERCQQQLNVHNLPSFDTHALTIIHHLTNMLKNPLSTTTDNEALIFVALQAFRSFSRNPAFLAIMKRCSLTTVFNAYASSSSSHIKKSAADILTRITDEHESHEFGRAMKSLDNEIELQNKKLKQSEEIVKMKAVKSKSKPKMNDGMEKITKWDEQKVRDFLIQQNLVVMISICDGINGEELYNLYHMCKTNSALMYRSLKSELSKVHHGVLSISSYLHFVSRLATVCDDDDVLVYTNVYNRDLLENF
ncbi:unnamed protein product [Rotaria socialis]